MREHGEVRQLFLKVPGEKRVRPTDALKFSPGGIEHAKAYSPLRQVLLTALFDLHALGYAPGELHENIVLQFDRLHDLASGTVLLIGEAQIQLTFHCEPCSIVQREGESLKPLIHRRGVLGKFLNAGSIIVGDEVRVADQKGEFIPYDTAERIDWFLRKQNVPVTATALLHEVGLSRGYARALPALLRKMPWLPPDAVIFASRKGKD